VSWNLEDSRDVHLLLMFPTDILEVAADRVEAGKLGFGFCAGVLFLCSFCASRCLDWKIKRLCFASYSRWGEDFVITPSMHYSDSL
jgi:hypothetical protein